MILEIFSKLNDYVITAVPTLLELQVPMAWKTEHHLSSLLFTGIHTYEKQAIS